MAAAQVNNALCLEYDDYARLGDVEKDYIYPSYEEAKSLGSDYMHACHGMLFAKSQKILWEQLPVQACVLMQMRYDGVLGFPGGLVDKGEDPVHGLNREMEEEIGLETGKHGFTVEDHVETAVHQRKKLVLHFFAKEITEDDVCLLERRHLSAAEYGIESLGLIRVPLYTMADGLRGFPAFLANQFIGNARRQLLVGLSHCRVLTAEEINTGVTRCNQHLSKTLLPAKNSADS
ncbi:hypothetical protein ACOMHN_053381 [Nucella lapillus]